ncbi:MAG: nucleotide exchange factor GrpE, partial [bacterium (Candidatus Stahlbacteria) CG23_combo_of_CG06-09_8_20_14_all_40_9]
MEKKRTKKELEEEIKTKNKEIKELRNKYLMALADLENYKKRAKKESGEFMKYANERLLKELISVVDNFERALTVKHSNNDFSKGIELIYKHLLNVLKKEGV